MRAKIILPPASTKGLIESDDAADFFETVLRLGFFGGEEGLLGGEDFEVVHGGVLHQAFGLLNGLPKSGYTFFTDFQTFTGCLPG